QEPKGATQKPIVLVLPFENQTKHRFRAYEGAIGTPATKPKLKDVFLVDRFSEAPRSILENMLGDIDGLTIVERQQADPRLADPAFGGLSGLSDADKAIKLAKVLRADLVVLGTIVDIHDEAVKFQGYGIRSENTKVVCQIRLRLIDIETRKV